MAGRKRKGETPTTDRAGGDDGLKEPAGPSEVAGPMPDLTPVVGRNLRRLRSQRGLSLAKLAQLSGVSRAMLGQVELGQSAPTINVLWKVCRALDVTFSAVLSGHAEAGTVVLPAKRARLLTSADRAFSSRALFPTDAPRRVEFYELRLAAESAELAEPHPPGTQENLVVTEGEVEIEVAGKKHDLATGDAIVFGADVPHAYHNHGAVEAVMYLVMTYPEPMG